MFFNSLKNQISIPEFLKNHNKLCIYRSVGGLGDILAMRMIFEDIKILYPDLEITWAVPFRYFAAAAKHPFVDNLIHLDQYKRENFGNFFDITTCCGRYESLYKRNKLKNRSDIWAEHFGLVLQNHNMFAPSYKEKSEYVFERLKEIGWDGKKKLIPFAPRSAISLKNMTYEQCKAVKEMTQDFFLFGLHTAPIIELLELKIPGIYNFTLEEALACVENAYALICTDTGFMHAAGGYNVPTLATFSFVDGPTYCKYYPSVQVVQIHADEVDNWCGPCYDYPQCPYMSKEAVKPCQYEITSKMLQENWEKLLNRI